MKITRVINGEQYDFELTQLEVYEANNEYERTHHRYDVKQYLEDNNIVVSENEIEDILDEYINRLDDSEDWFYCIKSVVEQTVEKSSSTNEDSLTVQTIK